MKNNVRNIYIDVMKGILITLVVIGHLPFFEYDSRTLTLIYSFHMHAFLIIGGILSHINENTKLISIIFKRVKNTLFPYFIFSIISLIIIPTQNLSQKFNAVIVMFRGIGDPINAINLPLWFLTFYFIVMLLFEIIEWISFRIKVLSFGRDYNGNNEKTFFVFLLDILFITVIMIVSYLYARYYKMPRIPFNIEIAGFCIGFVFLGKILGKYTPIAFKEIKKNTAIFIFTILLITLLLFIFIISWYIFSMYNGRIDLNARDYKNAFIMYVDAILGFYIFAVISYIISKIPVINNVLSFIGKNSLYILAYHIPAAFFANVYLYPRLPGIIIYLLTHNSVPSIMALSFIGISFSLIIGCIHNCINSFAKGINEERQYKRNH